MKQFLPVIACLLLSFDLLIAQNRNLKFNHISIEKGLSHSNVRGILQDRQGFMWFSTDDGLDKYDGYAFTVYKNDPDDSTSLSHNGLWRIIEDRNSNLWIATWGGGVDMFDRKTESFVHYRHDKNNPNTISGNFIYCLYEDRDGNIWIGTKQAGLNFLNVKSGQITRFLSDERDTATLGDNEIRDICEDKDGNVWIATGYGGVSVFDRKTQTFTRFRHVPSDPFSLANNSVRAILQDKGGNIWIGTYGSGVDLYLPETRKFRHFRHDPSNEHSLAHDAVQCLEEDDDGYIWIGTENGGLSIFNPQTEEFVNYTHDEIDRGSLNDNSIYTLFKDVYGNMWVGTFNDGISFTNKSTKFTHYRQNSSPNSLSSNLVVSLYEDSKKNLWIGTDGKGLNKLDRLTGTFTHYQHEETNPNSLCGNYVLSVIEDHEGNIWVGTWGDGLSRFNPGTNTYTHFKHDPSDPASLNTNNIWRVFEDSDQNIWIGTYGGGLARFDPVKQNFTHFMFDPNDPESISLNTVYVIAEDSKGYLWVGTDGGGLNRLDRRTGKFKRYLNDPGTNSLSHNRVLSICEDQKGDLWIGTHQGLNHLNIREDRFTLYGVAAGLPAEAVLGVLEDDTGALWIGTNKGIGKMDPETKKIQVFTVADGLQPGDLSQAACKSRSGAMYFGGKNGFSEFFPEKMNAEHFDPPLVFTGFEIFNKPVPILPSGNKEAILTQPISFTRQILLSYRHTVFSIGFASLDYTNPQNRFYSYKLDGFDKEWNSISSAHSATYTNLDPGEYTFRVKALTASGQWSKNMAVLKLRITPPFWQTWGFKILVFVSLCGIVFGWIAYRVRAIKQQRTELEIQVKERTRELSEANAAIQDQRATVEKLYHEVKDSIRAAEVIQNSILPPDHLIRQHLPEFFVLNKPKDVVSGDFYWFEVKNGKIVIAVADCTGHGVSGAFMSINGYHLLNKAIHRNENLNASEILEGLNEDILKDLGGQEHHNGMDIALCIIDREAMCVQYAGAACPLYFVTGGELIQVKGDRFGVGSAFGGRASTFTNQRIQFRENDTFYLFSDGYADQLGSSEVEKFMYSRFRELLLRIHVEPMEKQRILLEEEFTKWKGDLEQTDDILVLGFKIM